MGKHRYRRQPGIKGTTKAPNGRFRSQANHLADVISLGTFDTAERASLRSVRHCGACVTGIQALLSLGSEGASPRHYSTATTND